MKKGKLIVLSGPSGVGKGTVKNILLERNDALVESISATTRLPRPGEVDGVAYHFMSDEGFDEYINNHKFLEYCGVFGKMYGTPREFVEEKLNKGFDVLLEIDVQGALKVRGSMPEAVLIMLAPPSLHELISRLRGRGTETDEQIERRFSNSSWELNQSRQFDYLVINDNLEDACVEIERVIEVEGKRTFRNEEVINKIINE